MVYDLALSSLLGTLAAIPAILLLKSTGVVRKAKQSASNLKDRVTQFKIARLHKKLLPERHKQKVKVAKQTKKVIATKTKVLPVIRKEKKVATVPKSLPKKFPFSEESYSILPHIIGEQKFTITDLFTKIIQKYPETDERRSEVLSLIQEWIQKDSNVTKMGSKYRIRGGTK